MKAQFQENTRLFSDSNWHEIIMKKATIKSQNSLTYFLCKKSISAIVLILNLHIFSWTKNSYDIEKDNQIDFASV